MSACSSTPLSWLRLEQYALGELGAGRDEVAEHLAACSACRACFERIEADKKMELRPLSAPPLPAERARARRVSTRAFVAITSGLALAAALVLAVRRHSPVMPLQDDTRVKGGAVAFSLVRDDQALVADAHGTYADGDRFKVLVTCPPGTPTSFDLVVYDREGASFPLATPTSLACGNDVALPGAFRITGSDTVRVCLVWSEELLDRAALAQRPPASEQETPGRQSACKVLDPAR